MKYKPQSRDWMLLQYWSQFDVVFRTAMLSLSVKQAKLHTDGAAACNDADCMMFMGGEL